MRLIVNQSVWKGSGRANSVVPPDAGRLRHWPPSAGRLLDGTSNGLESRRRRDAVAPQGTDESRWLPEKHAYANLLNTLSWATLHVAAHVGHIHQIALSLEGKPR